MRRLLALVSVVALGLAGLAGCGEDEASAAERIRTAPSATADAGSAQVEMTMSGPGFELTSEGTMALDEQRGSLTTEVGDIAGLGEGLTMETVFDGLVSYQRSPIYGDLPGGAEWVRIDAAALNEDLSGVDVSEVQQSSSNPADMLATLEAVSEDGVEDLGTEEVRGEEATHYRASIDIVEALEDSDAVTDEERFEQFAELYGDEPVNVDVWLDDEGRAVRQDMTMEIAGQEVEISIELFDFGTDVDVEIPDESDSIDITELLPDP